MNCLNYFFVSVVFNIRKILDKFSLHGANGRD